MTRGPDQARLLNYVTPAQRDDLHTAHDQWRKGGELLTRLAIELRNKASQIRLSNERVFQGETATTAAQAFDDTAVTMDKKSKDMSDGSAAFAEASDALLKAQHTSDHLEKHGTGSFPKDPGIAPGSSQPEDVAAQQQYDTAVTNYWQTYHANEQAARDAIQTLQDNHTEQAKVFQRIHGETQDTNTGGGGGANPVQNGTAPTTTHVPGGGINHNLVLNFVNDHSNDDTPWSVPLPPGDPGVTTVHQPTTHEQPGIPQGPGPSQVPAGPGLPGTIAGGGTVGGGAGAMGGVGAVAGGALGGAAAAGLAAGGLSGGLNGLAPLGGGVRGGLSASGVRGIGATSRTGAGSVLGRGAGASSRAGAGGMSSRSGGRNGGRNGGRSTGRSAGTRGARGAGAGAGTGRNGKDKKRQGEERDLFDDGSDWIDDEDVAPGLLD